MSNNGPITGVNTNEITKRMLGESKPGFLQFQTNIPESAIASGSVLGAAFSNDNTVVAGFKRMEYTNSKGNNISEDFNSMNYVFPGYEAESSAFIEDQSFEDMLITKSQIDSERNAKRLLGEHKVLGFVSGIGANILDPVSWLPGGIAWNEAKAARNISRTILAGTAAGFVQSTTQESILSQFQLTRDFEESFWNIVGASLLSGAFGGIGGAVLGGPSGTRAKKEIGANLSGKEHGPFPDGHFIRTGPDDGDLGPRAQSQIIEGEFSKVTDPTEIQKTAIDEAQEISTFGGPRPSGSDVVSLAQLKQSESLWNIQPFVDKFPQVGPMLQLLGSEFAASKSAANLLAENNFISNKNFEGGTSANIETRIKQRMQTFHSKLVLTINDAYRAQRNVDTRIPVARDIAAGLSKEGLTYTEFSLELARALRDNGKHQNPAVESTANKLINNIINELRDEAISFDMLPEGVTPETALGYLTKMRNIPAIIEDMALDAAKGGKKYQNIVFTAFNQGNNQLIAMQPQINVMQKVIQDASKKERIQKKKLELLKKLEGSKKADSDLVSSQIKSARKELQDFIKSQEKIQDDKIEKQLVSQGKKEVLLSKKNDQLAREIQKRDANLAIAIKDFEQITNTLRNKRKPGIGKAKSNHAKEKAAINKQFIEVSKKIKSEISALKKDIRQIDSEQKKLQKKDSEISRNKVDRKKSEIAKLETKLKETIKKVAELKKDLERNPAEKMEAARVGLEKQLDEFVPRKLKRRLQNGKLEIRKVKAEDELLNEAQLSIERIIGTNDDRFESALFQDLSGTGSNPDVFHERVLMVDDHMEEAFLVNDPESLLSYMIKAMVPLIEFRKLGADLNANSLAALRAELKNSVTAEFNTRMEQQILKDPVKSKQGMEKDLKNIDALIDINLGIYGKGFNVFSKQAKEFWQNVRDWNFGRFGGFMGLASLPEPLSHALKVGVFRHFKEGLIPSIKSAFRNIDTIEETTRLALLRDLGYGVQSEMGNIARHMMSGDGLGIQNSIYRRIFKPLADLTAEASLLKKLQDVAENITGRQVISSILREVDNWTNGKIDAKADAKLNQLGLNSAARKWLHQQFKKHGGISDGAYWIDHTAIESFSGKRLEYYNNFRDAIVKDIDTTVVKPGAGDKPLFAHGEMGRTILQFKNWAMGANNRLLIAGMQRRDVEFFTGSALMLFGGLIDHIIIATIRGDEIDWDTNKLFVEALDRSGLMGIYSEVANVATKSMFGASTARYKSRSVVGAWLGPTFGAPDELLKLFNSIYRASIPGGEPLKKKDLSAAQRLIPLQNMWPIYQANRALTNEIGMGLGLED